MLKSTFATDWKPLPGHGAGEHIFAVGDIHGQLGALQAALEFALAQEGAPYAHLVMLGDLIDRGPAGIEAIETVVTAEERGDFSRVTYLPGNHELMMLEAIEQHQAGGPHPGQIDMVTSWIRNGGWAVLREAWEMAGQSCNPTYEDMLNELPNMLPIGFKDRMLSRSHYRAGDLLFVHAGVSPHVAQEVSLAWPKETSGLPCAWVRDEFLAHKGHWDKESHQVIVHGHTPCIYEPVTEPYIFEGAGIDLVETHRRINLDVGTGKSTVAQAAIAEFKHDAYRLIVVQAQ